MIGQRFITLGEVLLRLSTTKGKLFQNSKSFDINYGGSEANVAIALSNMGVNTSFFTVFPDNDFEITISRILWANKVDTSKCIKKAKGRQGSYYLETGASMRSSRVIYDREYSAFSLYDYSGLDLKKLLENYTWVHLSGITPALSKQCRDLTFNVLKTCKELGITVSFDGNFRDTLWSIEEARTVVDEFLPYIDVLLGLEPFHLYDDNGVDLKKNLTKIHSFEVAKEIFAALNKKYPNIKYIFDTVRDSSESSEKNTLKAYFNYEGVSYESEKYRFGVIDRVGSGDAFTSGTIYGLMNKMQPEELIKYALHSSMLELSTNGDYSLFSAEQIMKQCNCNGNYDVQR